MGLSIKSCKTVLGVLVIMIILCIIINFILIVTDQISTDKDNSFINSIYFTTTTMSSVGYGDILPVTPLAKICVAFQQLIVLMGSWGVLALACNSEDQFLSFK